MNRGLTLLVICRLSFLAEKIEVRRNRSTDLTVVYAMTRERSSDAVVRVPH